MRMVATAEIIIQRLIVIRGSRMAVASTLRSGKGGY